MAHLPDFLQEQQPAQLIGRGLLEILGSLIIGNHRKLLRTGRSNSRLAAALSLIMPEQHEGQNLYIAERLCGLGDGSKALECLQVALFLVSNNFGLCGPDESLRTNRPPGFRNRDLDDEKNVEPNISKEDRTLMALFYLSGLNTIENLKHLLSLSGVTAHAIAHKLFASAVRSQDIRTVRMALEAGVSPDTSVLYDGVPTPPLVLASGSKKFGAALDMCDLLLSYGSGLKEIGVVGRAFYEAIRWRNCELVKLFLSRNIPIAGHALRAAIVAGTPDVFSMLLDVDPDINKRAGGGIGMGFTILGLAVDRNDMPLAKHLLGLGAEVDALEEVMSWGSHSFKTTTLGLAIHEGNNEMIDLFLAANPNVNYQGTSDRYIPPLVVSVEFGANNVTRRLLSAGADVSIGDAIQGTTLLQRSLRRDDLELSRLLMSYGASIDPTQMEDYYTSVLYKNVKRNNLDTVTLLLSWGARRDDIYDEVPDTILGAAIAGGHCEMIRSILQTGATNTGQTLVSIRNLKTAEYLEHVGLLSEILHRCGQPILVSAIRQDYYGRDDGLVQFLLARNVDRQPKNIGVQPFEMMKRKNNLRNELQISSLCSSPLQAAFKNPPLAKLLVERGAPITDLELAAAVDDYRCIGRNFEILQLFLDKLSQHPCAVPNAFGKALEYNHVNFLIHRFLEVGLDPGGKVVANGASTDIFLYQLHGTIENELLDSVLEQAVIGCEGALLGTLLNARTWTAVEKGRALTKGLYYKHRNVAQKLLDAGADVNQACMVSLDPYTPLCLAIQMEDISLTRRLVALGADAEWSRSCFNNREKTLLCIAVRTGNRHIVKVLLDAGADVNRPASSLCGRTALQEAAQKGNVQIVDMLLDAGADVNQDPAESSGGTALQLAAIQGYIGIARKLLGRGANVNAKMFRHLGRTALEGAVEHGRIDMLQMLLDEGASIEGSGRRQYIRAIKLAENNGQFGAVKLLRDHGGRDEMGC